MKSIAVFLTISPVILIAEVLVKKASIKLIGATLAQLEFKIIAPNKAMMI